VNATTKYDAYMHTVYGHDTLSSSSSSICFAWPK